MLPEPAAGGGATSFYKQVKSADAARRQRMATVLGYAVAFAGIPVIVQTVLVREGTMRVAMIALVVVLSLLCVAAGMLARLGYGTVAGLWLTAVPCLGSVIAVAMSREVGAAPFYGSLGVVVALATLDGRALRAALWGATLSAVAIAVIFMEIDVVPTKPAQLVLNAVVLVMLTAVVVALHGRTFAGLLEEVAAQQARTAHVEARYRVIAENTMDLVALIDAGNVITWASPSFQRVLGLDPNGRPVRDAFVDEPDAAAFEMLLTLARAGQIARSEVRRRRADGVVGRFECVVSPTEDGALLLCAARDVTAERAMADLEHAKKMEALGRFAGSIAHDFNNLLSVMRTCTTLASQALPVENAARAELNDVQEAISRASGLTSQLLAFSRRDVVLSSRVETGPLLQRAAELATRLVGERVRVVIDIQPEIWALFTGPAQVDQIVMNLAANARGAMPNGGTLRLTARNAPGSSVGDAVLLTFADSGSGISAEARAHLFEPFFTTKPPGIGTGLGLATVFGVVKALGGVIEVESEPEKGTEFRIWLPRAQDAAPTVEAPAKRASARRTGRSNETIVLVVDDDADVRSLMVRLISHEGFQVVSAANAEQAMAAAMNLSELPVLVTDVLLPGKDGLWLAQRLLDRFPSMRVVLVSGFAPDPQATARLIAQGARFVQKPFTPGVLVFAIRESLGLTPQSAGGAQPRPRAN